MIVVDEQACIIIKGGALLTEITPPGYHLMLPFITEMHTVQITLQASAAPSIVSIPNTMSRLML